MPPEPTLAQIASDLRQLTNGFNHFVDNDFKEMKGRVERFDPVLEAYDSVIFGKKFVIGLSTFVGSLAALGAAILWLYDHFIKSAPN